MEGHTFGRRAMKIAYLMNQHPYASCTFIRREIVALEKLGFDIERFSIRPPETGLVDDSDCEEAKRTRYILKQGVFRILTSAAQTAISRPAKFFNAVHI